MSEEKPPIVVALAGNPNCGKTSIFNHLTGARQHVGNFSGVTVTKKEGTVRHKGRAIRFVDLPGIYSLSSQTLEEVVARDYLLSHEPDLILNVLDAGNLERNLFLTCQLIETDVPRIHCLNMVDEAQEKGIAIDRTVFDNLLGGPSVETNGRTGDGLDAVMDAILAWEKNPKAGHRYIPLAYDPHVEEALGRLSHLFHDLHNECPHCARFLAVKLLEGDEEIIRREANHLELMDAAMSERARLAESHGEDAEILLAAGRYGFIHGLLAETVRRKRPEKALNLTRRIDNLLIHKGFGLPLFFAFMWLMFQATFTLGDIPIGWIETGVEKVSEAARIFLPAGELQELITDGIIGGVGGVIVFLPNIMILFLFISFFEDTGYMARVAFLMDRFMHAIGLHGKAFIPLLMGFGCNVPAIMATRTMENPRDRLLAILINPFMSCSARLPVYVLFVGAFFTDSAATALFAIYMTGILAAMGTAFLLKKTAFRGVSEPFVMELPPYRLPTLRSVLTHMWEKAVSFLKKVSGVILVGSVIIWFLQAYPREVPLSIDYDQRIAVAEQLADAAEREIVVARWETARAAEIQEKRFLGRLGQTVQPIFDPLGVDWKGSVALLTGFIAKEVVVSTLGVLYSVDGEVDEESSGLRGALKRAMTPAAAAAFMIFTLLYIPCLSTIAVIRRETGSRGWTAFSVGLSLTLAWTLALAVHWVGSALA